MLLWKSSLVLLRSCSLSHGSWSDARPATMPAAIVLSPFTAANATWALNPAVWDFRFCAMFTPFLDSQQ